MKKLIFVILPILMAVAALRPALAAEDEPTVYIIQKGDTLWGLSDKFLKDPYFWPNLWERNQQITNPHLIFPGQRVKFYRDRIEVEDTRLPQTEQSGKTQKAAPATAEAKSLPDEIVPEKTFLISGGEGFLLENGEKPAGFITSTYQNRQMVGEDDVIYTDIGRRNGAKVGDRFSIYRKMAAISHPVTNVILGYKVIPLGTLQLSELEDRVSKALITKSYQEISAGAYLMPYRDSKREVALKAADKDLVGYIVETKTGNKAVSAGEVAYLDLGRQHGLQTGNILYVVRDVTPDQKFLAFRVGKLPAEVIGAVVVVETGDSTSTALVVKSIDTIYRGDRVEVRKNK